MTSNCASSSRRRVLNRPMVPASRGGSRSHDLSIDRSRRADDKRGERALDRASQNAKARLRYVIRPRILTPRNYSETKVVSPVALAAVAAPAARFKTLDIVSRTRNKRETPCVIVNMQMHSANAGVSGCERGRVFIIRARFPRSPSLPCPLGKLRRFFPSWEDRGMSKFLTVRATVRRTRASAFRSRIKPPRSTPIGDFH